MALSDDLIDHMITDPVYRERLQRWADAGGDTSGGTEEIIERYIEKTGDRPSL